RRQVGEFAACQVDAAELLAVEGGALPRPAEQRPQPALLGGPHPLRCHAGDALLPEHPQREPECVEDAHAAPPAATARRSAPRGAAEKYSASRSIPSSNRALHRLSRSVRGAPKSVPGTVATAARSIRSRASATLSRIGPRVSQSAQSSTT